MGIYHAIMDDKNRRKFNVWKAYALARVFDQHAPFTLNEIAVVLPDYEEDYLRVIVEFCDEADWSVRLISDATTDEWYETDYDEYEFDRGNLIPSKYKWDDSVVERLRRIWRTDIR